MKLFKRTAFVILILFVVLATGAIVALNSEGVHRAIEEKIHAASGFDVRLGKFRPAFPLRLGVGPTKLSNAALDVEFDSASVRVNRVWPPFGVDVEVKHPRITQRDVPAPPKTEPPPSPAGSGAGGAAAVPPLKLALRIDDGEVTTPTAAVTALNLEFRQAYLLQSPASLTIDAFVKAGPLPAPIPLHVETSSLTLTPTSVAADDVAARVAGVVASLRGASDLDANKHDWFLKSDVPDLTKVPRPDAQIEAWRGAVRGEVKVQKTPATLDADGFVDARDVSVTLRARAGAAAIAGSLKALVDLKFGFHRDVLTLPNGRAEFDLTDADVTFGDLLKKARAVPLGLTFAATGDGARVTVSHLDARLGDVKLTGRGQAAATKPFAGKVDFEIPATDLASLERTLPALGKVLIRGRVDLRGGLEGPLANVGAARVRVDRLGIDGPLGSVVAKGTVAEATSARGPRVDLRIETAPLRLAGARTALPNFKDLIPDGDVRAKINLAGTVPLAKPWPEWPLEVSGDVNARVPEYTVKVAPATPGAAKPAPGVKGSANPTTGFLPKGYLTEHLRLHLDGEVKKLAYDKLVITGAGFRGEIARGELRGDAQVAEVFRGRARVASLVVPLVEVRPVITGDATWAGLVIEEAVGFVKPAFRDFASGQTAGRAQFRTHLPGEVDFLSQLEANGDVTAEPVTLNSVKLGELINQSVGKLPGVQMEKVKMTPLRGRVNASFNVARGVAELPNVLARDVDNSELKVKGSVNLNTLHGDLGGTFAWANSPVKGCLAEGNSDDQKRLVIPVTIKGDLMHPGVSLVGDTLKAIAGKAIECEGKKLIERAKKDGVEGLKNEAGKVLKGLFGR